jgi:hypothetical protein
MSQDPFDEWIDEAVAWLAERVHDNLELEQALRQGLWRGAWHLSLYQGGSGLEGLSLVTPAGRWLLEGVSEPAVIYLTAMAAKDRRPVDLVTSAATAVWARPLLAAAGLLRREEELLNLVCRQAPERAEGRWAEAGDLPLIAACLRAGTGTKVDRDWPALVAARRVALLARASGDAACVSVSPETARFALLDEVHATGEAAWRELGEGVVGFATRELLAGRPAVRALAPEPGTFAALLGRLGFASEGHVFQAGIAGIA